MTLSATMNLPGRRGSDALGAASESGSAHGPLGLREGPPLQTPLPVAEVWRESVPASDEELLGRYRDFGVPEDFAELFHRYSGELGRYLARYRGDSTLTDDLLQETFLRVHAKCGLYRDGWPVRAWLYAIAIRCATDALRRSRRLPSIRLDEPRPGDESLDFGTLLEVLSSADLGPLEALEERERQQWVRDCVGRLPEPQRQVLVLAYYQDLSYAEIVGLLGIPLGTVKSRLHGAIARLREMAERAGRP